nr:MAG TPA: hypothetical protein [Caudoviricetes sp.]
MRGLRRSESAAFTSSRCWQRAMCSATRLMFVMLFPAFHNSMILP